MTKQAEELLKRTGFDYLTGTMWKHKAWGMVSFIDESDELDILKQMYEMGQAAKASEIRTALRIR